MFPACRKLPALSSFLLEIDFERVSKGGRGKKEMRTRTPPPGGGSRPGAGCGEKKVEPRRSTFANVF